MKFDRVKLYIIFISGNLFSIGLTVYKQHSMGLKKYLEFVERNWIDFPPAGASLILFASVLFIVCVAYEP